MRTNSITTAKQPAKFTRVFAKGDRVQINHQRYNNYPMGTEATVTFCGMLRNGTPSYRVIFDDEFDMVVMEGELKPAKKSIN